MKMPEALTPGAKELMLLFIRRDPISRGKMFSQYLSLNIPGEFFIQILSICTWKIRIRLREKIVINWYKRWTFFSSHNH